MYILSASTHICVSGTSSSLPIPYVPAGGGSGNDCKLKGLTNPFDFEQLCVTEKPRLLARSASLVDQRGLRQARTGKPACTGLPGAWTVKACLGYTSLTRRKF